MTYNVFGGTLNPTLLLLLLSSAKPLVSDTGAAVIAVLQADGGAKSESVIGRWFHAAADKRVGGRLRLRGAERRRQMVPCQDHRRRRQLVPGNSVAFYSRCFFHRFDSANKQ